MASNESVTEIAFIPLKAGVDVNDENNPGYQAWQDTLSTVSQQAGYQRAYYGPELEDPSTLQLLIDWDSLESHLKFIDSPAYGPFVSTLGSLLSSPPYLHHFQPTPFPPSILGSAPVVEMATFYGTGPHFLSNVEKFTDTLKGKAPGYIGLAYGPVVEEIEKTKGEGKGKAVVVCIGWESKEAHLKFRDSEDFKENIHYLRDGVKAVEVHHTAFKTY